MKIQWHARCFCNCVLFTMNISRDYHSASLKSRFEIHENKNNINQSIMTSPLHSIVPFTTSTTSHSVFSGQTQMFFSLLNISPPGQGILLMLPPEQAMNPKHVSGSLQFPSCFPLQNASSKHVPKDDIWNKYTLSVLLIVCQCHHLLACMRKRDETNRQKKRFNYTFKIKQILL